MHSSIRDQNLKLYINLYLVIWVKKNDNYETMNNRDTSKYVFVHVAKKQ